MSTRERDWRSSDNLVKSALAPFTVRKVQRADGSDSYQHQDGGEQDDNNQGSLLASPKKESNSIAKF